MALHSTFSKKEVMQRINALTCLFFIKHFLLSRREYGTTEYRNSGDFWPTSNHRIFFQLLSIQPFYHYSNSNEAAKQQMAKFSYFDMTKLMALSMGKKRHRFLNTIHIPLLLAFIWLDILCTILF
jgi:hypothetical protein